jgi:hypothetical protein
MEIIFSMEGAGQRRMTRFEAAVVLKLSEAFSDLISAASFQKSVTRTVWVKQALHEKLGREGFQTSMEDAT